MNPLTPSLRRSAVAALALVLACSILGHGGSMTARAAEQLVFFGTGTRPKDPDGSKGIYVSRFDDAAGTLSEARLAAEIAGPGFLELHPNGRFLYATARADRDQDGAVAAFSIDPASGDLTVLNRQTSGGRGPCHVTVDATGNTVLVANYSSGSCGSYRIEKDGSLSEPASFFQHEGSSVNPKRQEGPHAHSVNFDPSNQYAVVADLGIDEVRIYRVDHATGKLSPNDPASVKLAPGAGPRHFHFHPSGRFAYVINELASTITAFTFDAETGTLTEIETVSTLPDGFSENNSTAEVRVHPSGKFLYGSNRGHNTIAVFRIDEGTGKITFVEHEPTRGEIPRNFNLDPTGRWLFAANQNSDHVTVFEVDAETGALEFNGQEIRVPAPMCIRFLPLE